MRKSKYLKKTRSEMLNKIAITRADFLFINNFLFSVKKNLEKI